MARDETSHNELQEILTDFTVVREKFEDDSPVAILLDEVNKHAQLGFETDPTDKFYKQMDEVMDGIFDNINSPEVIQQAPNMYAGLVFIAETMWGRRIDTVSFSDNRIEFVDKIGDSDISCVYFAGEEENARTRCLGTLTLSLKELGSGVECSRQNITGETKLYPNAGGVNHHLIDIGNGRFALTTSTNEWDDLALFSTEKAADTLRMSVENAADALENIDKIKRDMETLLAQLDPIAK